jgi:CMP/dCMP kinase
MPRSPWLLCYGTKFGMGIVIAIDGPAGAGKSTIARRVAAQLGYTYIDTGAMYRAVALWALRQNLESGDAHRMGQLAEAADIRLITEKNGVLLNGEDVSEAIRDPQVSEAASRVATIPGVRRALVAKQRAMAGTANVVMEGRDIGTVVFPDATLKIFLDADQGERVRRRVDQFGVPQDAESVMEQIADRDRRDTQRAEGPLTQAPDAVYLDSTGLSIDQVADAILKLIRARVTNGKAHD